VFLRVWFGEVLFVRVHLHFWILVCFVCLCVWDYLCGWICLCSVRLCVFLLNFCGVCLCLLYVYFCESGRVFVVWMFMW